MDQYDSICVYIIYHGISFISSKFCLPTRQHLTTWRRYSSRLIWVLLRTQGQHSPSHLYGDVHTSWRTGWGKQGRYKYQKKTKNMTMDQWNPVNTGDGWWWFPSSALAELENQEGFEGSIQSTMGPMGVTWGHLFPACLRDGHEHVTLNHRVPKFQCPPFFTSTVCYSTQKKACLYPPVAIFGQKSIWKNPTWLKDPRLLHSH